MSEQEKDYLKLSAIVLLHLWLYIMGSYLLNTAQDDTQETLGVVVVILALFLPLYLTFKWASLYRTMKLTIIALLVSDVLVEMIPYLHYFTNEIYPRIFLDMFGSILRLLKLSIFTYGICYYLVVRQEKKHGKQ